MRSTSHVDHLRILRPRVAAFLGTELASWGFSGSCFFLRVISLLAKYPIRIVGLGVIARAPSSARRHILQEHPFSSCPVPLDPGHGQYSRLLYS